MDVLLPIYWVVFGIAMIGAVANVIITMIAWRGYRGYDGNPKELARRALGVRNSLIIVLLVVVWPLVFPYVFIRYFVMGIINLYRQWKFDFNGGNA